MMPHEAPPQSRTGFASLSDLDSLNAAVTGLRGAVADLHGLVGTLARDHASTREQVDEHARRLAARALIASLPETCAIVVLGLLASRHMISGELGVTAVLGVLGFRLAPGRLQGTSLPPSSTPPTSPPAG